MTLTDHELRDRAEAIQLIQSALAIFEQAYPRPIEHVTDANNPVHQWMGQARQFLAPINARAFLSSKDLA